MDAFWNLSFSNLAYKLCKDNNVRGFQIILELQPELAKEKFTVSIPSILFLVFVTYSFHLFIRMSKRYLFMPPIVDM